MHAVWWYFFHKPAGGGAVTGTMAATIPMPTMAATGIDSKQGAFAGTIPLPTMSATGIASTAISGTLAVTAPIPTMSASGVDSKQGSFAVTIPLPTMSASGDAVTAVTGSFAGAAPLPTMSASGSAVTAITGTFTGTLPIPTLAATGTIPTGAAITGTFALSLPVPTLAMSGSIIQMVQSLNSPHARRKLRSAIAKPSVMIAKRLGAVVQIQNRATTIRNVYAYPLSERDAAGTTFGMDVDERQRIFIVPALQGSLLAKVIATAIASNVVTLTCSKKHWFVIGQEIRVTMDDEDDDIDGLDYTVAAVPADASLTYSKTASDRASSTAYGSVEAVIRPGDTIWFEAEPYTIDTIEPDQFRSSYRLTCTSTRARTLGTV